MKMNKTFDCVKMKNDIQRKMQAERSGMTDAQWIATLHETLEKSDSPLARRWRDLHAVSATHHND